MNTLDASTRPMAVYRATERIYLDSRGRVCGSKDPDAHSLLLPAGGTISLADARYYGLIPQEVEPGPVYIGEALAAIDAAPSMPTVAAPAISRPAKKKQRTGRK